VGAIRSIITRVLLLATVLITVAALWRASQQDLAVEADNRYLELFEQLVSTDLTQTPAGERLRLMRRLDWAFRSGADWQEPLLELDEPAWTQFRENLFALLHDWLINRANKYHERGEGGGRRQLRRQNRFVDDQVDTVMAWVAAAPAPATDPSGGVRPRFAPLEWIVRVQQWTNEAEGEQRERLEAFTTALVTRARQRRRETMSMPGA
jgi:hypothetical protein